MRNEVTALPRGCRLARENCEAGTSNRLSGSGRHEACDLPLSDAAVQEISVLPTETTRLQSPDRRGVLLHRAELVPAEEVAALQEVLPAAIDKQCRWRVCWLSQIVLGEQEGLTQAAGAVWLTITADPGPATPNGCRFGASKSYEG